MDRSGHARNPSIAEARPDETQGRGKNRARFDEARAARTLDKLESLAHLAWPPPLLRAQAGLFKLRGVSALPERKSFSADGRSEVSLICLVQRPDLARDDCADCRRARPFCAAVEIALRVFSGPHRKDLPDRQVHCARS